MKLQQVDECLLPSGVVTFVLTDIVGSTKLWEIAPEPMESALADHDAIIANSVTANHGVVLKGEAKATRPSRSSSGLRTR